MGFPKKIKKTINLTYERTLYPRRVELLERINKDGTFLPKSVLHADLDRGVLDFVKSNLEVFVDGIKVPIVDIIMTTQNWSQFTETWNFQDIDKNAAPPFMTLVRMPEVKYGSNPAIYNIPDRKQFYYASVPSYDGNRLNVNVYSIPQPVPVDIKYSLKFICNRIRELNMLNKNVLQTFTSRQAYTQVNGHYIPLILDAVSDESVLEIEKRKYYIQNYDFTLLGFLIDEEEFQVKPAVERTFQLFEIDTTSRRRSLQQKIENPDSYNITFDFASGSTSESKTLYDRIDLEQILVDNISSYEVYINDDFYGDDLVSIKLNHNDTLRIDCVKQSPGLESKILFRATMV